MTWLRALGARPIVGLLLLGAWVLCTGLERELWTPDEPRVAAIGRAMWQSGEWAVPRLAGEPFLEKPPLYWWIESASFAAFGEATPAAALPGAFDYAGGHVQPFWYYAARLPATWLPWTPSLVLAGVWAYQSGASLPSRVRDGLRWSLAGTLPVLVVLSLAGTKRTLYLDPVLPLAALAVGAFGTLGTLRGWSARLDAALPTCLGAAALVTLLSALFVPQSWPGSLWRSLPLLAFALACWHSPPRERADRQLAAAIAVALGLAQALSVVGPRLDETKRFTPFVQALEREVPEEAPVFAVAPDETLLGVLGFYTDRRVVIARHADVRDFAASPEPHYLLVRDRRPTGGNWQRLRESGVPIEWLSESRIGPQRTLRIAVVGGDR